MGAGDNITKRLRHVTDDMKAYKQNREHGEVDFEQLDRMKAAAEARRAEKEAKAKATAVETAAAQAAAKNAATVAAATNPPVFGLEGKKRWVCRHQKGTAAQQLTLEISEASMDQAVHIQHCAHLLLVVKAKVNSVMLVDCKKVQVSLTSVVSSVEIINSHSVEVQVAGALPSANIENSHSVNLYLMDSESARKTEVLSTASSAMNINFPDEADASETLERPLPEQFVSKLVPNGKGGFRMVTAPSEIC